MESSQLSDQIHVIKSQLEERDVFENIVFHLNNDNIDEASKLVTKFDSLWTQQLLVSAFNVIFTKLYGDLFALTGTPKIKFTKFHPFTPYLFARGLIQETDFDNYGVIKREELKPIEEYEMPIKEDNVLWPVIRNDLHAFTTFITIHKLSPNPQARINLGSVQCDTALDLACFYDSIDIIKYMLVNGVEVSENAVKCAIRGASEECIQFLEQKGASLNRMLYYAIQSHNNNIAKWLFEYQHDTYFKLPSCVQYFNSEMLMYFVDEQKWNVNELDYENKSCLHYAAEHNDVLITKYLLVTGCDKTLKERYGKTAFDIATNDELKRVLE